MFTGGPFGGLAGTGITFLQSEKDDGTDPKELWKKRVATIVLYMLAGVVAGKIVQVIKAKKKK